MTQRLDVADLLSDTSPAEDSEVWQEVMGMLADYASRERSGAQIRIAREEASTVIADSRCGAWLIAPFGEPAVIIIRQGLAPGMPTWHAARMLVALGGSPSALEPGEAGMIHSREKPSKGWTSPEDKNLDRLANATLRSMGLPRWLIRRISRQINL